MIERLEEVSGRCVPRETAEALQHYVELLREEAARQNLIAASTVDRVWERHIFDSAQLVRFEPAPRSSWLDIGSGAGLPGVVIALLVQGPVTLVEPRRLRAEFLQRVIAELGISSRLSIAASNVQDLSGGFDVITARAVAPLDKLLRLSTHLSTEKTLWALPKGRSARSELDEARRSWQCEAEIVPSCTDPESEILLLRRVRRRGRR